MLVELCIVDKVDDPRLPYETMVFNTNYIKRVYSNGDHTNIVVDEREKEVTYEVPYKYSYVSGLVKGLIDPNSLYVEGLLISNKDGNTKIRRV